MAASHKPRKGKASSVEDDVRQRIVTLSLEHPDYGARRLLPLLKKEHRHLSETAVYNILRQKGLQNREKRLARLEEQFVLERITLNDRQWQALESHNPCLRERQTRPSRPGLRLYQSTRRVLAPDELGPVFLHATVDAYCLLAFGILTLSPHDIVTDEVLETHVFPFYRQYRVPVHSVLTIFDPSSDSGDPPQLVSAADGGPDVDGQGLANRSNGFVDYFFQMAATEFFGNFTPADGRWTLDTLQADFTQWLDHYNHVRPQHGFPNMGGTPFGVFVQSGTDPETQAADTPLPLMPAETAAPAPDPPIIGAADPAGGDQRPTSATSRPPGIPHERAASAAAPATAARPVRVEPVSARKSMWRHTGQHVLTAANLILILLIVWFGVSGFIKIQGDALSPPVQPKTSVAASNGFVQSPTAMSASDGYQRIWQRDLFQTRADSAPDKPNKKPVVSHLPKATDIDLALVGTVVFSQSEKNYAIVYDSKSDNQLLLHQGDRAGNVHFKQILRNKVIIDSGSGEQLLAMEEETSDSTQFAGDIDEKSPSVAPARKVPTSLRRKYLQNRLRRIYRARQQAAERE